MKSAKPKIAISVATVFVMLLIIAINVKAFNTQTKTTLKIQKRLEDFQLKITVNNKSIIADIESSKTAEDFVALLPLTLTMDDLGHREKYSALSKHLSEEAKVTKTYKEGDLSYWLGGGLAAFYNNDGHEVKAGLIVLARMGKGIEIFKEPGTVKVKFEVVKK